MTKASIQPPTLYDETHRSIRYPELSISSMANRPNLIGHLEHHAPTTDGSFSICVAGGKGVFISQALYESIPAEHRPVLDTTVAGQNVSTLTSGDMKALGSIFMPIILVNSATGQKFRIVIYALVLPRLFMGMFISGGNFLRTTGWIDGTPYHGFSFDDGKTIIKVKGV